MRQHTPTIPVCLRIPPARRRRGLTLPELIIGIVITSVLLLALSVFTVAVGAGWSQSNQTHAVEATSNRAGLQLDKVLRGAMAVVQVKAPTAEDASSYLFYWNNDGFGGSADGLAQVGEMGLVEYDPAQKTIWLHRPLPEAAMSAMQQADAALTNWGDMSTPAVVSFFKGRSYLTRRVIAGRGNDVSSTASLVTGGQFDYLAPTDGKPIATYNFTVASDDVGQSSPGTLFGSVAIRAPQTPLNAGN